MVNHHHAMFGGHKQCGSGYVIYLVVDKQDSTCSRLNPPLLFICLEHMA